MFYSTTTDTYINEGTAFTIGEISYPSNWLNLSTAEEKAEIGLEEVIATNSPASDKYYWVSQELNGATLTYVNTPKDIDACKKNALDEVTKQAYDLLLPSDYMASRAFETNTPMLPAWVTWRSNIRAKASAAIAGINACTTIDELSVLPAIEWDKNPSEAV